MKFTCHVFEHCVCMYLYRIAFRANLASEREREKHQPPQMTKTCSIFVTIEISSIFIQIHTEYYFYTVRDNGVDEKIECLR